MAVDRSLRQIVEELEDETDFDFPEETTTIKDEDGEAVVIETEDGGAEVTLGAVAEDAPQVPHGGNLVEVIEDNDLRSTIFVLIFLI